MVDRKHFERLDEEDPLADRVGRFSLPDGLIYLDGNSLGPLPSHVPDKVSWVVQEEWGRDLIRSWNANGWWEMAGVVGDMIAPLIGAPPGSVIAGDATSIALYKAVSVALRLCPTRRVILTDSGNFPTDLYVLGSVAAQTDATLVVVEPHDVAGAIDESVAVLALTHVDYRTGRRHDMADLTAAAHRSGAIVVWDLAHSAGAMDLDLSRADMAVGCGYKYLNGGPGAPAFVYVRHDHLSSVVNPIAGWWGHAEPFAMSSKFMPAPGIQRMQVGTQPIIALAALQAALEVFDGIDPKELRSKSQLLTGAFIRLVEDRLDEFEVVTPHDAGVRGSHVSLAHPQAPRVMASLISEGVIGDVRPPNLLRFGFAPVFQRHTDVWDAVETIERVMADGRWRDVELPAHIVT
ncbi:kynureninase [soil metagenome]